MSEISVAEFEAKILEREDIVVKVRAPEGTMVKDYDYQRKATDNQSVTEWIEGRVKPCLNNTEVVVIDGKYSTPHGRTKLETLRKGYER